MNHTASASSQLHFAKMHGLGNDFMVIDLVTQEFRLAPKHIQRWADRKTGVGFDQLLVVEPPTAPDVDFDYRIFNADGSAAEQCGNGVRCIARFVTYRNLASQPQLALQTGGRRVRVELAGRDVEVALEAPSTALADVPFSPGRAGEGESSPYPVQTAAGLVEVTPISVGNPHAVIFVDDVVRAKVNEVGGQLSRHPCFPQGANIGFCEVVDRSYVRLRVHERGVGETRACGTGACAAVVAGRLHGKLDQKVKVSLPGGKMHIHWQGAGAPVRMIGAATLAYEGVLAT